MTTKISASDLEALRSRPPTVHNGTYTVNSPRGHFTLKLFTVQDGNLAGRRVISLLTGPNNEKDFTAVAFWNDAEHTATVWQRFRGPTSTLLLDGFHWQLVGASAYEQKIAIWCDLVVRGATPERHGYWFGEGYTLLLEGRCVVCNRKLTHPESIQSGIGPDCAAGAPES